MKQFCYRDVSTVILIMIWCVIRCSLGTIWMAPSSLKGQPGFGIYTTRDIAKKEAILAGPDGPSLPVIDSERGPSSMRAARDLWFRTFNEYWWGRGELSMTAASDSITDVLKRCMCHGSRCKHEGSPMFSLFW